MANSSADDGVDPTRDAVSAIDWIIRNPGTVISVAGVLAFAVLQVALRVFYSRFGVTLSDVGLSYASVLTQHETLLLMVATVTAGLAVVLKRNAAPVMADLADFDQRIRSIEVEVLTVSADTSIDEALRTERLDRLDERRAAQYRHRYRLQRNFTWTQRLLALALVVVPIVWACITVGSALQTKPEARQSHALDPLQIDVPPIELRAVTPQGVLREVGGPELGLEDDVELLLLGQGNGSLIVYDVVSERVLRLDQSLFVAVQG